MVEAPVGKNIDKKFHEWTTFAKFVNIYTAKILCYTVYVTRPEKTGLIYM